MVRSGLINNDLNRHIIPLISEFFRVGRVQYALFEVHTSRQSPIAAVQENAAMPKRIIAAIIGMLAMLAGVVACSYAYDAAWDLRSSGTFWSDVAGALLMGAISLSALLLGMRFLRFAVLGRSSEIKSRFALVLLGLGCFVPGFIVSVPFAVVWEEHKYRGHDVSPPASFVVCLLIGVLTAIVGCVVLLRRRDNRQGSQQ